MERKERFFPIMASDIGKWNVLLGLLVICFGPCLVGHAFTVVGQCPQDFLDLSIKQDYTIAKARIDGLDLSRFPVNDVQALRGRWGKISGEFNVMTQKELGINAYCSSLKSKAQVTDKAVDSFNLECGNKDWDSPAYSKCYGRSEALNLEMSERQAEHDKFFQEVVHYVARWTRLTQDLSGFLGELDAIQCAELAEQYHTSQERLQRVRNEMAENQEKINILRQFISETPEMPTSAHGTLDFAACETLAYQMLDGNTGGVHCTLWDTGDWYQANPRLGQAKVEKYYLEGDNLKLDLKVKKIMAEWDREFRSVAEVVQSGCPRLHSMGKLE